MRMWFLILGRQNELEAYASRKNSSEDLASFPRPLGGSRDLLDLIQLKKNLQQKSAHTLPVITHAKKTINNEEMPTQEGVYA